MNHLATEPVSASNGHPGTVHVMLDLETWGTLPGSALRSVGAVTFSPYGDPHEEKSFYANISRSSCEDAGLKVDPKTERWWADQSPEARTRLEERQYSLSIIAHDFSIWWWGVGGTYVWSNGANFDEVLWRVATERVQRATPWKYWNVRDTRTCWHLARLNHRAVKFEGMQHDAVADARHQAKCVTQAYEMLGIRPGKDSTIT